MNRRHGVRNCGVSGHIRLGRAAVFLLLFVGLPACWLPQAHGGFTLAATGAQRSFVVDSAASEVTVLLFKEGIFSGFAHNHVLVSKNASGTIELREQGAGAETLTGQFSLPVVSFSVDLPEHRRSEEFTSEVSTEDRKEIRAAMLGPEQLDAERHPRITASIERVEGDWPRLTVWIRLRIKGVEKLVPVPLKVKLEGARLTAQGEFAVLFSDFAIEPFSIFLGAVSVQDRFRVRFSIQAEESR